LKRKIGFFSSKIPTNLFNDFASQKADITLINTLSVIYLPINHDYEFDDWSIHHKESILLVILETRSIIVR